MRLSGLITNLGCFRQSVWVLASVAVALGLPSTRASAQIITQIIDSTGCLDRGQGLHPFGDMGNTFYRFPLSLGTPPAAGPE